MKGCQTCLELITDEKRKFHLTDIYFDDDGDDPWADTTSIKDKLTDCIPELLLDGVNDIVLCQACASSLTAAYQFKQQCLGAQNKISGYLQQMPNIEITVTEIALHYKKLELVASGRDPTMIDINTTVASKTEKTSSPSSVVNEPGSAEIISTRSDNESLPTWLTPNLENQKHYYCNVCHFVCRLFSLFCFHMLNHDNDENPEKCKLCEFTTVNLNLLIEHMQIHKRERRLHVCTNCNWQTKQRDKMVEHSLYHDNPFECHVCKWKFPNKIELVMHLRYHSYYMLVKCQRCGFRCYTLTALDAHMKKNVYCKTEKCPLCTFVTTSKSGNMNQHMISVHKIVNAGLKKQFGPNSWSRNSQKPGTSARQH